MDSETLKRRSVDELSEEEKCYHLGVPRMIPCLQREWQMAGV